MDAEGKAIWLIATDASGFYERLGYRVVAEKWLAKDNPEWDGGPFAVKLVSVIERCNVKSTLI